MTPTPKEQRTQPWRNSPVGKGVVRCAGFAGEDGNQITGFKKGDLVIIGGQAGTKNTVLYDTAS